MVVNEGTWSWEGISEPGFRHADCEARSRAHTAISATNTSETEVCCCRGKSHSICLRATALPYCPTASVFPLKMETLYRCLESTVRIRDCESS